MGFDFGRHAVLSQLVSVPESVGLDVVTSGGGVAPWNHETQADHTRGMEACRNLCGGNGPRWFPLPADFTCSILV